MNYKAGLKDVVNYKEFSNPWKGLACMIFVQADQDYRKLSGNPYYISHTEYMTRDELGRFYKSWWAEALAQLVGYDIKDIRRYAAKRGLI